MRDTAAPRHPRLDVARRFAPLFVALLALCPEPPAARAQSTGDDAPAVDERAREQAREHYQRGRRRLQQNRYEDALEEFARAYALFPHWATSNSMGVCHDELRRPAEAYRLYVQALAEGGGEIPEAQRTEMEARVAALRIQLGIREDGTVEIRTQPPGASLRVDGEPAGTAPATIDLPPGSHRIEAELEGYQPRELVVEVAAGQTARASLALDRLVPAVVAGRLVCDSDPSGARVTVDDLEVGWTPVTVAAVEAGERRVRLELPDGRVVEERVTIPPDGTARFDASFGGGVSQAWFWTSLAGALALGGGALGTGLYGRTLYDEFHDPGTTRERQAEIEPTGSALMITTDVLTAVAGALAVTAGVLAFFTDFGDEAVDTRITYDGPEPGAPEPIPPDDVAGGWRTADGRW
jgi:hypothetical protein